VETPNLINAINDYLDRQARCKHPDDRTKVEDALIVTGEAFLSYLVRYGRGDAQGSRIQPRTEEGVLSVMRSMNEVNREYDLRDVEAQALASVRKGRS
jgi:hypothetical protein